MSDILNKIAQDLGDLEGDAFLEDVDQAIAEGIDANTIVDACAKGVDIVGDYFEEGEYFVGELVYTSEVLGQAMKVLEPLMGGENTSIIGSMVIGTVQGDLHDIGKNIFISMMKAAGFKIHDLGVDVPPEKFVEKIKEVKPDLVGMSGLLTLSVDMMKQIVESMQEAGVRDDVKIMIGGNIVNDYALNLTGADAWSTNASTGVKQCKAWMGV